MALPTRVTIIPGDSTCGVDGLNYSGVDMTSLDPNIHAIQWYGTEGEIEIKDSVTGKMLRNETITNLDSFQAVLDSYWEIRNAAEAALKDEDEVDDLLRQLQLQQMLNNHYEV